MEFKEITPEIKQLIKDNYPDVPLFIAGKYQHVYKAIDRELMNLVDKIILDKANKDGESAIEEVYDLIFLNCVVYPEYDEDSIKEIPVGFIRDLVNSIQQKSGFIHVNVLDQTVKRDVDSEPFNDFEVWVDETDVLKEEITSEHPYKLFKITVGEYVFIVKQLNRHDIKVAEESDDLNYNVCLRGTVWPKKINWDMIPAGIIPNLFDQIVRVSGWESEIKIEEF